MMAKKMPHRGKVSKDQRFPEMGARVREIEKELEQFPTKRANEFRELAIKALSSSSAKDPELDALLAGIADEDFKRLLQRAMEEIRGYVQFDQTVPIPVKYVGRALRDMKADDETTAVTRIEVFAFFHSGLPSDYLAPFKSGRVNYVEVAEECHQYVKRRHAATSRTTATPRALANRASQSLEKPIKRLEDLALADAVLDLKTSKRAGSFLTKIGQHVFEAWPEWPGE